ncbi:uncharacterized protein MELLADRAFT_93388 [Melampsora larici-populina 98AG31]|uniref:Uncharacterized protein n=1 Tax=Melampsora larici-populina (strain 98AG31 / pathotype 3-4-7) TaxID=747676 RepID=F4RA72_MELLP|nr:uncharacterized protein MELLADRAFT_93388 [Melampsora larici-populina 98AG31]EGG10428.1 hypothetical protein MELLADRAFT_93388 [Melampsora larici-populina 98AG31]
MVPVLAIGTQNPININKLEFFNIKFGKRTRTNPLNRSLDFRLGYRKRIKDLTSMTERYTIMKKNTRDEDECIMFW